MQCIASRGLDPKNILNPGKIRGDSFRMIPARSFLWRENASRTSTGGNQEANLFGFAPRSAVGIMATQPLAIASRLAVALDSHTGAGRKL